jgi:hypothetical protein
MVCIIRFRLVRNYLLRFALAILERNHVVVLPILFSCQGTDFREGQRRLPPLRIRVKRKISRLVKSFRLTRPLIYCLERTSRGIIYNPLTHPVISNFVSEIRFPVAGPSTTPYPPSLFQAGLHKLLCRLRLRYA